MDSLWAVVLEKCIYYAVVSLVPLLITLGILYGAKLRRWWQVVASAFGASALIALLVQNWKSENVLGEYAEAVLAMTAICAAVGLLLGRKRLIAGTSSSR